jgi:hypothetical protein
MNVLTETESGVRLYGLSSLSFMRRADGLRRRWI